MLLFVSGALESPLCLLIQRHYAWAPLSVGVVVRHDGKEKRNETSEDTAASWLLQWREWRTALRLVLQKDGGTVSGG